MSYIDDRYSFWLVQRLEPGYREGDTLLCEYMGSAEFEYSSIPKARKRLSEYPHLITKRVPVTIGELTRDVFFLADAATIDGKIEALNGWISDGLRGQERSGFEDYFSGMNYRKEPLDPRHYTTKVWWSISDDIVWALEEQWLDSFVNDTELRVTPSSAL